MPVTFLTWMLLLGTINKPSYIPNEATNEKALAFIKTLNTQQREKTLFPFADFHRQRFSYLPEGSADRVGIQLKDLEKTQLNKLDALLQVYLSEQGFKKVKTIISLETILRQLNPANTTRDPLLYRVSFYGEPGKDSSWGWKFEGHHLSLNFTVVKNKIAFAPFFFGSNPAEVRTEGALKGLRVLSSEEDLAFELINSLNPAQRNKAIIATMAYEEILSVDSSSIRPLEKKGLFIHEMSRDQQLLLDKLIGSYLSAMPPMLAEMRRKKIRSDEGNEIQFAWGRYGTER
jgi:hypothetical protein